MIALTCIQIDLRNICGEIPIVAAPPGKRQGRRLRYRIQKCTGILMPSFVASAYRTLSTFTVNTGRFESGMVEETQCASGSVSVSFRQNYVTEYLSSNHSATHMAAGRIPHPGAPSPLHCYR